VLRRATESAILWQRLEDLTRSQGLPERSVVVLYDAALGYRVRRPQYEKDVEIETGAAGRDLRMLTGAGLIVAQGEARARHYVGTPVLRQISKDIRANRAPIRSPYGSTTRVGPS
jgi:hypothetical protein